VKHEKNENNWGRGLRKHGEKWTSLGYFNTKGAKEEG
jgi:hypothetical protein